MSKSIQLFAVAMLLVAGLDASARAAHAAGEPIVVVVRFHPAPGREDELQARLLKLSEFVQKHDPAVTYRVHRSKKDPVVFLLYETFPSEAALDRQATQVFPAFQKLNGPPPEGIVTRPVEREEFRRLGDSPNIGDTAVEKALPKTSLAGATRPVALSKEKTMQYMLTFYETAEDFASRADKRGAEYWAGWRAYVDALTKSGIVRSGAGLQPPATATTLRLRGASRKVQDGPFADAKEQLGGFFVIETKGLEEALEWAARAPCASSGGVEVRPVLPPRQP